MATAVIILQYNNYSETIDCLKSFSSKNSADTRVIIVDNGSKDIQAVAGLKDYLESAYGEMAKVVDESDADNIHELSKVTFLVSHSNDGYARGNNKGIMFAMQDASIDSFLILNNDTKFIEDLIPVLLEDLACIGDCGFVAPRILTGEGKPDLSNARRSFSNIYYLLFPLMLCRDVRHEEAIKCIDVDKEPDDVFAADIISGSCMMCTRRVMEAVGGFDPHTFLYCEENIMHEKLKRLGLRFYVDRRVSLIHLGGASVKKASRKQSDFILKASADSMYYYLKTYRDVNQAVISLFKGGSWTTRQLLKFVKLWRR